jgi:threonine dehydrogenase-like Zn-dependent dehydrogenase
MAPRLGRAAITTGATGTPMEVRMLALRPLEPGELLVRVTTAMICGSDLHMWRGEVPWLQKTPGIQGHEMVGVVEELSPGRDTDSLGAPLRPGDRVAYAYFMPCGECPACLSGTTGCPNRYRFRNPYTADERPFLGAYAEYYYVLPGQWVFKVPDGLPDDLVAPVNCALSQVVYGLQQIRVWLGDTVVIQGAGGLGLYAVALARDLGAGRLIAVDGVPERLELARAFGADAVINIRELPDPKERVRLVRDQTRGQGADLVVEVAGVPAVVQEGLEMLRVGGRYLWMGNIVPGAETRIVPHDAVRQPKQILGVLAYDRWVLPRALGWLARAQSRYPLERLVSQTYPLEQINDAFGQAEWSAGKGQVGRVAVSIT